MIKMISDMDRIEDHYRRKVLLPHRKKHDYPNHSMDCQLCTPCVRDIFDYIRENYSVKIMKGGKL